jgi:uncharacterized protein (UPF0333 family)
MRRVKELLKAERGQGGIEYLLMLAALIGIAAVVAYFVLQGYSSAGQSASGAMSTAASSASAAGTAAWQKYSP